MKSLTGEPRRFFPTGLSWSWRNPIGAVLLLTLCACSPYQLVRYVLSPDVPRFADGDRIQLSGLEDSVEVAQREDGMYRIRAANERDAALVEGYLMARDRMAQLDLFRHLARGELAALLGDRSFGERTSLEMDVLNRFLGFREQGSRLYGMTSTHEQAVIDAFVQGINHWITEKHLSLEHRLLGITEVRPWTVEDSLAIYAMLMHGLSANADREIRRLVIACRSGLDAMERIWPTDIEFTDTVLPEQDWRIQEYPSAPAVVPEMASELADLCPKSARQTKDEAGHNRRTTNAYASLFRAGTTSWKSGVGAVPGLGDLLYDGWSASNSWVVGGSLTASGKPVLSSDPHLPHMNPPIVWGVEVETPGNHVAGFLVPGLHRIVFGHNGHVAFGATTNHVDRQDLVVYRPHPSNDAPNLLADAQSDEEAAEGYEVDGAFVPFERRTEAFAVKGGDPVTVTARITRDGPLLNDIDFLLRGRIPLTALRVTPLRQGDDLNGAALMNQSGNVTELAAGVNGLDLGCSNWLLADTAGTIAYRSPCIVPVREGFSGAFPIPGWLTRYDWKGYYEKRDLPRTTNPERDWLATANSQVIPSVRFPSTYNSDVAPPNRYERISGQLKRVTTSRKYEPRDGEDLQLDRGYDAWPRLRTSFTEALCDAEGVAYRTERRLLCEWDGVYGPDSPAATLFVLFSNAVLDRALADEFPDGAQDTAWHFVQSLPQFETRVEWLWMQPADAPVWDDVRTARREVRADILIAAFEDAVAQIHWRFGDDEAGWVWGRVRPFVLCHPFAPGDGLLGRLLNEAPVAVGGAPETVFKNQFPRSDREHMNPMIGPVLRFTVDMANPWAARYTLAGGQSGWPRSPHYGDLLADWATGRSRPLTPPPADTDIVVRFEPAV